MLPVLPVPLSLQGISVDSDPIVPAVHGVAFDQSEWRVQDIRCDIRKTSLSMHDARMRRVCRHYLRSVEYFIWNEEL